MARKSQKKKRVKSVTKPAGKGKAAKGRPANGDSRSGASGGEVLPRPKATVAQIDTLVALMRSTSQHWVSVDERLASVDQRLASIEQQRQQEQELLRQQGHNHLVAVPTPPAPGDATCAARSEVMADLLERVRRIEATQEQSERFSRRDAPASVMDKRQLMAGACKSLGFVQPTPAIIGRAMHVERAFAGGVAKSPFVIFHAIYAAVKQLLGPQAEQSAASAAAPTEFLHLDAEMVALMESRSTRRPHTHARYYDDQLKPRLRLLENMQLARVEKKQTGRRTSYSRYLTASGRELFDGWPEWTDASGGTGMLDDKGGSTDSQAEEAAAASDPTHSPT